MSIVSEMSTPIGKYIIYNEKPDYEFAEVTQVHGNTVLNATKIKANKSEADGIYCLTQDLKPMAIKTADCLPICVCGEKGVAMLHAGWRGVESNIFSPENLAHLAPFHFSIGPAISVDNYEVQSDFIHNFPHLENCFIHRDQKIYFDLKLAAYSLISHQFPSATIVTSQVDTFTTTELHSYRKDKTVARNWNLWLPDGHTA